MEKAASAKIEKDKNASKSFTNRVSGNSIFQNSFFFALAYSASHHYTLFAICGYAISMGVTNLFFMLLPTVALNSLINLGHAVYYLIAHKKALSRYPLVCSMNASQLATLSFIYTFGYFAPTVHLFQK